MANELSILDVAAKFCELSDWSQSNLGLQKITYIAQMFSLGGRDEELFPERFQAWDYGPVAPALYHELKEFGKRAIPEKKLRSRLGNVERAPEEMRGFISRIYDLTVDKSPGELVDITHWQEGAWAKNYKPGVRGIEISVEDMRDEYDLRGKVGKQKRGK